MVLMAVFIPVAFFPGTTGKIYQQFALTIAFTVALSTFNALSFSPAMSALLLRPHAPNAATGPLTWFFVRFNRGLTWVARRYKAIVALFIRLRYAILALFVAGIMLMVFMFRGGAYGLCAGGRPGLLYRYCAGPRWALPWSNTKQVMTQVNEALSPFPENSEYLFTIGL